MVDRTCDDEWKLEVENNVLDYYSKQNVADVDVYKEIEE